MQCLKQYSKMAKFREFYVQAGAGSNFLAKHCLWTSQKSKEFSPYDANQNEFFIDRTKSDAKVMSYGIRNPDTTALFETVSKTLISPAKYYDCPDKSILSESKRIKPILRQLDKSLSELSKHNLIHDSKINDNNTHQDRSVVIKDSWHIWREEFSVWTNSFFHIFHCLPSSAEIDNSVLEQVKEAEDFFAKCREYYYDECERNNWDVFQISHQHPYFAVSPRLKFPANIDTMAMELDVEMNMYNNALIDIKMHDTINLDNYIILEDDNGNPRLTENLFINKGTELSNHKVSFRKIYFENDENEIRRMYDFFDNEDYFDKNKTDIMSEFKQYHDDNMKLVQKLAPSLYNQLNDKV